MGLTSTEESRDIQFSVVTIPCLTILSGSAPTRAVLGASEVLVYEYEIQVTDDTSQYLDALIQGHDKLHGGFAVGPVLYFKFWKGEFESILRT